MYAGRVCACTQRTGAAGCESLRQDRPGRLTSHAFPACSSASPFRARCVVKTSSFCVPTHFDVSKVMPAHGSAKVNEHAEQFIHIGIRRSRRFKQKWSHVKRIWKRNCIVQLHTALKREVVDKPAQGICTFWLALVHSVQPNISTTSAQHQPSINTTSTQHHQTSAHHHHNISTTSTQHQHSINTTAAQRVSCMYIKQKRAQKDKYGQPGARHTGEARGLPLQLDGENFGQ